jgi:hypothetical protein
MTQIAATAAALGGKAHGTGKTSGAKAGVGTDFAAVVAGLGSQAGDSAAADPDGFAPVPDSDAETSVDAEAGKGQGKAGEPVIVDLALGAAAQSAIADMVVAPPTQLPVQSSVAGALDASSMVPVTTDKTMLKAGLPTRASGSVKAGRPDATPASTDMKATAGASVDAGSDAAAQVGTALLRVPPQIMPNANAKLRGAISLGETARPAATSASTDMKATAGASVDAGSDAAAQVGTALLRVPPQIVPNANAKLRGAITRSAAEAAPASVRPSDATVDIAPQSSASAEMNPASASSTVGDEPPAPLMASEAGGAVKGRGRVPQLAPTATAIGTAPAPVTSDGGQTPATEELSPLFTGLPGGLREAGKGAAEVVVQSPRIPATVAKGTQAEAPLTIDLVTSGQGATGIQPVMSTLHRSVAVHAEAPTGDSVALAPVAGDTARRDANTGTDGGSGSGSGAATLGGAATQVASTTGDGMTGGIQFADIIQSLPPIAQSRIGLTGDVASVTTGPVDVGATLQGQVIDMGVGGQWIDRMAKEITALATGTGHSRFQLNPPNLGRIQIDVWQGEGGGRVQLLTETDEAAQRLRAGQSSLQSDARLAALQLNSVTIDRAQSGGFDTPRDQSNQSNQGNQQTGQTGSQGTNQQNANQQNGQQSAQAGMQGGNSNGQGKGSWRRDVLNHQADTVNQQEGTTRRDGDRLVRYA